MMKKSSSGPVDGKVRDTTVVMSESSMKETDASSDSTIVTVAGKAFHIIGSTTSTVVAAAFFGCLATRRDALMVSFFLGSIGNAILSKVLKKILDQDRPSPSNDDVEQPSDKGMPSSHAMSLGFIGTFTAMTLSSGPTSVLIVLYVITSLRYRIRTNLHTPMQVGVGLVVGTLNGVAWRTLCTGTNPILPSVHIMASVSNHLLDPGTGRLPPVLLVVPIVVGALVVGSVERKISKLLKQLRPIWDGQEDVMGNPKGGKQS